MRKVIVMTLLAGGLALGGCARNYAGEGAAVGAAVGAGVGAVVGGVGVAEGGAIGAAAGAVGGATMKKDDRGCYRYDRDGTRHWDKDC